jgi:hypothetical protein
LRLINSLVETVVLSLRESVDPGDAKAEAGDSKGASPELET